MANDVLVTSHAKAARNEDAKPSEMRQWLLEPPRDRGLARARYAAARVWSG